MLACWHTPVPSTGQRNDKTGLPKQTAWLHRCTAGHYNTSNTVWSGPMTTVERSGTRTSAAVLRLCAKLQALSALHAFLPSSFCPLDTILTTLHLTSSKLCQHAPLVEQPEEAPVYSFCSEGPAASMKQQCDHAWQAPTANTPSCLPAVPVGMWRDQRHGCGPAPRPATQCAMQRRICACRNAGKPV